MPYQWLHRLVWAVVYVFGVKRGIGNETLSEFFHLVRLDERIGVSPNALQRLRVQMEAQVLRYRSGATGPLGAIRDESRGVWGSG
jgi:hypothetical protein